MIGSAVAGAYLLILGWVNDGLLTSIPFADLEACEVARSEMEQRERARLEGSGAPYYASFRCVAGAPRPKDHEGWQTWPV